MPFLLKLRLPCQCKMTWKRIDKSKFPRSINKLQHHRVTALKILQKPFGKWQPSPTPSPSLVCPSVKNEKVNKKRSNLVVLRNISQFSFPNSTDALPLAYRRLVPQDTQMLETSRSSLRLAIRRGHKCVVHQ